MCLRVREGARASEVASVRISECEGIDRERGCVWRVRRGTYEHARESVKYDGGMNIEEYESAQAHM